MTARPQPHPVASLGVKQRTAKHKGAKHRSAKSRNADPTSAATEGGTLATPQMSLKRGLKVLGAEGVTAVKAEMLQLHERKVMTPKPVKELTREQKKEALEYLMFLKRKRCGRVKGRGCEDGRKQRPYTTN